MECWAGTGRVDSGDDGKIGCRTEAFEVSDPGLIRNFSSIYMRSEGLALQDYVLGLLADVSALILKGCRKNLGYLTDVLETEADDGKQKPAGTAHRTPTDGREPPAILFRRNKAL